MTAEQLAALMTAGGTAVHNALAEANGGEPVEFLLSVGSPKEGSEGMAHVTNHDCPGCLLKKLEFTAMATILNPEPDSFVDAATGGPSKNLH